MIGVDTYIQRAHNHQAATIIATATIKRKETTTFTKKTNLRSTPTRREQTESFAAHHDQPGQRFKENDNT